MVVLKIAKDETSGVETLQSSPSLILITSSQRLWKDNYLTNKFHFAVRLYSDNAQMTSKHGKNKEVRYEPQASSVTDVLTMF